MSATMSVMSDFAALASALVAIVGSVAMGVRWLVKMYLHELVPNGGSSMADRVTRIEDRVNALYDHLITTK